MVLAAAAAVAARLLVPASPVRTGARFGGTAALLLSGWLVGLLLAVGKGPEWGWGGAQLATRSGRSRSRRPSSAPVSASPCPRRPG
ncbi:hypothetical protein [Actinomadura sp. WMMB 499]|uniref:hypothetical protein n=1 Tax=Actinomadura sp. WMMB 499 TaxID=1219491 RepID=UPI001248C926|nr:hypothetical protein [Actinomadura sp. WMMB 499]QFG24561.1 hypothetical protein F7P10_28940 [Actinomadura sp. WMMB 499]